jgi:transcriptional regulator with XRE-family HTH domain
LSYELSSNESNEAIGKRIRDKRNEMGLSQRGLANKAKTSQQAISRIERGRQEMNTSLAARIAQSLEISMEYLVHGAFSLDELPHHVKRQGSNDKIQ